MAANISFNLLKSLAASSSLPAPVEPITTPLSSFKESPAAVKAFKINSIKVAATFSSPSFRKEEGSPFCRARTFRFSSVITQVVLVAPPSIPQKYSIQKSPIRL